MKTRKILAIAVMAALALGLAASGTRAQYQVPLRYDMRFTGNPGYIGPVNQPPPPAAVDPYAFGSLQYGNLMITGNVRGGRSFQGPVPYGPQGSQLSVNLPSMALFNFSRDSTSLADVAGAIDYGATPQPYFAGSGSVTSLYTAQTRFATPPPALRPAYTVPNLNTALPIIPPTSSPGVYYVPPPAAAATASGGLVVPQFALDWVRAMDTGASVTPTAGAASPSQPAEIRPGADRRLGKPLEGLPKVEDVRIGIPREKGRETPRMGPSATETIGVPMPFGGTPGVTATSPESFESTQSALFWAIRDAAMKGPETGPPAKTASTGTAPRKTAVPEETPEELPKGIPPMPEKYVPPGTYEDYVKKAQIAMTEGNYAKAESIYAAASAQDASKSEAVFGRIYALLADRQYDLAHFLLDRDLRVHPDWVKQAPNIARALSRPGVYDRLTTDLKADMSRRPGNPELSFLLGFIYFSAGNNDEAMFYLRHLARIRGKDVGPEKTIMDTIEAAGRP